jgi:hypothetical protein
MVKIFWDFKDFSQSLGMLLATTNVAKSAQIYQNLPKDT